MPSPSGARSNSTENIANTLSELETERCEALTALETAASPGERVRLRSKLVFLERRLRWYRGRALPKDVEDCNDKAVRADRIGRNIEALTEVHKAAGVDLGRTGTARHAR